MMQKRYVARSTAIASRALGDETMIMSAVNSTLFTLDEIATVIWDSANGLTRIDEIVSEKICAHYAIAPETALHDAEALVEQLAHHGLLLVSDQPIATPGSFPRAHR